jgi:AraC-like DNA-binding protein
MLYSLFLNDLTGVMERIIRQHRFPKRVKEIFLAFLHLLPQHFAEHHDIPFYADMLHITPVYPSRVVRQVTGRTVVDYINQMRLMEASFLLQTSPMSITQIADRLHFADTPSFSKFFSRLKGVSPKEYRKG